MQVLKKPATIPRAARQRCHKPYTTWTLGKIGRTITATWFSNPWTIADIIFLASLLIVCLVWMKWIAKHIRRTTKTVSPSSESKPLTPEKTSEKVVVKPQSSEPPSPLSDASTLTSDRRQSFEIEEVGGDGADNIGTNTLKHIILDSGGSISIEPEHLSVPSDNVNQEDSNNDVDSVNSAESYELVDYESNTVCDKVSNPSSDDEQSDSSIDEADIEPKILVNAGEFTEERKANAKERFHEKFGHVVPSVDAALQKKALESEDFTDDEDYGIVEDAGTSDDDEDDIIDEMEEDEMDDVANALEAVQAASLAAMRKHSPGYSPTFMSPLSPVPELSADTFDLHLDNPPTPPDIPPPPDSDGDDSDEYA